MSKSDFAGPMNQNSQHLLVNPYLQPSQQTINIVRTLADNKNDIRNRSNMHEEAKDQLRINVGKIKSDVMPFKFLESNIDGKESVITPAFKCRMHSNFGRDQQTRNMDSQLQSQVPLEVFP